MFHTDYTDVGYIHCIDDIDDYHRIMKSGIWDYIKGEKESGRLEDRSGEEPDLLLCKEKTGILFYRQPDKLLNVS